VNTEGDEADVEFAGDFADGPADGALWRVDGGAGRDDGLDPIADCVKSFGTCSGPDDLNDGEAGAGGLLDSDGEGEAAEGFGGEVAGEEDVAGAFFVPVRVVAHAADGEHGDSDGADEALGVGAEKDAVDAAASVSGDGEEIDRLRMDDVLDGLEDGALAEKDGTGDALIDGHQAEVIEIVLEVELHLHQGTGENGGHAIGGLVGHDVHENEARVIDLRDVDGAFKGRRGRFGEIDGDEDPVSVGESDRDRADTCKGKWVGRHTSTSGNIMLPLGRSVCGGGHTGDW